MPGLARCSARRACRCPCAGTPPDDAALRRHCRERLADYKVPETITWSPEPLPRNANGKVMKRLLRERLSKAAGDAGA